MRVPGLPAADRLVRTPLATLFATAFSAAVLGALANFAVLALRTGVGRLGRLEPAAIVARVPALGWAHRTTAPAWLGVPWDLTRPGSAAEFLLGALALYLAFALALALALSPAVALAARHAPPRPGGDRESLWLRVYCAALAVLFATPATQAVVHGIAAVPVWRPVSKGTAVASAAAFALLVVVLRDSRRTAGLLRAVLAASLAALAVAVAAGGATALARVLAGPRRQPGRAVAPSVLLISIDSLRADHVRCYGYDRETTPAIDALAREGARFSTVISPTSWTLPAQLTLLTGLPPEAHGVVNDRRRLRAGVPTLASAFQRAGYETAGFAAGPYLAAEYGFLAGFDFYDDGRIAGTFSSHRSRRGSAEVVDATEAWLGSRAAAPRRPFFAFVHLFDCHAEYAPPPPFDALFDPGYRGPVDGRVDDRRVVRPGMAPRDLAHLVALYDGAIRFTDSCVGHLVEYLRKRGALDDTIVVVTADHGEEFFEHGAIAHENNLYDEVLRVPLVIRYPAALPRGSTVTAAVRLMDVPPTLLALAGASDRRFGRLRDGGPQACVNLLPLTRGGTRGDAPPLVAFGDLHGTVASVRTDRFKLVRRAFGPVKEELYDLQADPGERRNLAPSGPAILSEMRSALSEWRLLWRLDEPPAAAFVPEAEHLKRLRALGYM